jgi:hypothetical protein
VVEPNVGTANTTVLVTGPRTVTPAIPPCTTRWRV